MASVARKGQVAEEHRQYKIMGGVHLHGQIKKTLPWVDWGEITSAFTKWKTFKVEKPVVREVGPIVGHSPPSVPPVAKELPSARCFSGGGPTPYGYDIVAPIMVVKHEKGVATKTFPGASRSEPHMEY